MANGETKKRRRKKKSRKQRDAFKRKDWKAMTQETREMKRVLWCEVFHFSNNPANSQAFCNEIFLSIARWNHDKLEKLSAKKKKRKMCPFRLTNMILKYSHINWQQRCVAANWWCHCHRRRIQLDFDRLSLSKLSYFQLGGVSRYLLLFFSNVFLSDLRDERWDERKKKCHTANEKQGCRWKKREPKSKWENSRLSALSWIESISLESNEGFLHVIVIQRNQINLLEPMKLYIKNFCIRHNPNQIPIVWMPNRRKTNSKVSESQGRR